MNQTDRIRARADQLRGTPFVVLPGYSEHSVVGRSSDDKAIRAGAVMQVFNDALLMDALHLWGEDGPLYETTVSGFQKEIYELAVQLYATVTIPAAYRRPQ